jgi:hypothetical protein
MFFLLPAVWLETMIIMKTTPLILLAAFTCVSTALALDAPPDGGYPSQNIAEGEDAFFSLTSGADNTAMGFDALDGNSSNPRTPLVSFIWRVAAMPNTPRFYHKATLLQNGMVLVAGGIESNFDRSASAELYDPASGTWITTGSLNTARSSHTATLLQNGMVLVAGGISPTSVTASAELYDPASGTWTATGSLNTARYLHTATLLQNGMVLVAGGYDNGALASAEL